MLLLKACSCGILPITHNIKSPCLILCTSPLCCQNTLTWTRDLWIVSCGVWQWDISRRVFGSSASTSQGCSILLWLEQFKGQLSALHFVMFLKLFLSSLWDVTGGTSPAFNLRRWSCACYLPFFTYTYKNLLYRHYNWYVFCKDFMDLLEIIFDFLSFILFFLFFLADLISATLQTSFLLRDYFVLPSVITQVCLFFCDVYQVFLFHTIA